MAEAKQIPIAKKEEKCEKKKFESCFIITPIGESGSEINREAIGVINAAIKPALITCGFFADKIESAIDINLSGAMEVQIVEKIIESDLVIANLTGNNANVLYELAIRHATGDPIILIIRDDIHPCFDISNQRHIKYKNDAQGVIELRGTLENFLRDIDKFVAKNVIYDVLTKTKVKTIFQREDEIDVPTDKLQILFDKIDKLENAQTRNLRKSRYISEDSSNLDIEKYCLPEAGSVLATVNDVGLLRKYLVEVISEMSKHGKMSIRDPFENTEMMMLADAVNIATETIPGIHYCSVLPFNDITNSYRISFSLTVKTQWDMFMKRMEAIPGISIL